MKERFHKVLHWISLNRTFVIYICSGWLAILCLSAMWSIGYFSGRWNAIIPGELLFFPCAAVSAICLVLLVKSRKEDPDLIHGLPEKTSAIIRSILAWTEKRSLLVLTVLSFFFICLMVFFWNMLSPFPQIIATVIYGTLSLLAVLLYFSCIARKPLSPLCRARSGSSSSERMAAATPSMSSGSTQIQQSNSSASRRAGRVSDRITGRPEPMDS